MAVDSADLVLMNSRLTDLSAAIRLSRKTLKNIRENLFWAFIIFCSFPWRAYIHDFHKSHVERGGDGSFQCHRLSECPSAESV